MNCPRCGAKQKPGASFCNACGAPMTPIRYERPAEAPPYEPPRSGKKTAAIVVACTLLLILAVFLGSMVKKTVQVSRMTQDMNDAAFEGDYDRALFVARELYNLTGDRQYLERSTQLRDEARLFAADQGEAPAPQQPATQKEPPKKDAAKPAPKPEKKPAPKKEDAPPKQASSNGSSLSKVAANLKGKDIISTALHANVRTDPSINAPIAYALEKGSTIHVYDTVIEGNIIWLDTGDGWTSHKNFNGDLKY